jgi:hypothetical protein
VTERVCIVGCGAIGSLYAAHLAQLPGLEVWAFDVSAEHVEAINRDGLRLTGAVQTLAGLLNAAGLPNDGVRRRPRAAVDQAPVQRGDQSAVRGDRPHPRRDVGSRADA